MYSERLHSDLAVALERYQEGNHPSTSIFSIRECSWDDVLEEMTQAEDEYHAKGQGSLNFVRKGLRKAGDYAPAINPWFDLIPEGDGLKTLSSGLKLVFTVRVLFHFLSDPTADPRSRLQCNKQSIERKFSEGFEILLRFSIIPRRNGDSFALTRS